MTNQIERLIHFSLEEGSQLRTAGPLVDRPLPAFPTSLWASINAWLGADSSRSWRDCWRAGVRPFATFRLDATSLNFDQPMPREKTVAWRKTTMTQNCDMARMTPNQRHCRKTISRQSHVLRR